MKKSLFYELKIGLIFLGSQGHFTEQFGSDLKITNVDYGTCINLSSSLQFRHPDGSCAFYFSIVE